MTVITQFFPSFEAALAACGAGYNDSHIADVIAYKTSIPVDLRQMLPEQAINVLVSVGTAAACAGNGPLHVLDFGGGCGVHYFTCAQRFRIPLRWAIVETAPMAQKGKEVAQGRFELFTEIAAAADRLGRIDLVLASGAIPYVPDPLDTLKALVSLRPRHFALARFPVWGAPQTIGLQTSWLSDNGIGPMPSGVSDREVRYPLTLPNFDEVMRTFEDYELISAMDSPSSRYIVRNVTVKGITLIFRTKDDPSNGRIS
jgi:putative methyltransferase (TIGR04325 family)